MDRDKHTKLSMKAFGVKAFRRLKAVIEGEHFEGEKSLGNAEAMEEAEKLVKQQVRDQ